MISFNCPFCRTLLEAEGDYAYQHILCPKCTTNITVPAMGIAEGTVIAGYRVERHLGCGGLGEVYQATQLSMDRKVALKVLPPAISKNRELIEAFMREARVMAKLEHSQIVTAFDVGEEAGLYYLAMAFVEGEDLAKSIARNGPLSEKEALALILKLANALSYAWDKFQIIHHDIKPANIMVEPAGDVKLLDMGLSRQVYQDTGISMAGLFENAPNYVSPEQALGQTNLDCRSDIYSLGATLYFALTGVVPYGDTPAEEILAKHVLEPPAPVRKINPQISSACSHLVEKMMSEHPQQRYADWTGLIEDAKQILAGDTLKPRQTGGTTKAGHPVVKVHKTTSIKKPLGAQVPGVPIHAAKKSNIPMVMTMLVGVAMLGGIVWFWRDQVAHHARIDQVRREAESAADQQARKDALAEKQYQDVAVYLQSNPWDFEGGVDKLKAIQHLVDETKYEEIVEREIQRLQTDRKKKELETAETEKIKKARIEEEQRMQLEEQRIQEAYASDRTDLFRNLADDLFNRRFEVAVTRVNEVFSRYRDGDMATELETLKTAVESVAKMPDLIVEDFKKDVGKEIPIKFKKGTEHLKINRVSASGIKAERVIRKEGRVIGAAVHEFTYEDLAVTELLSRIGHDKSPDRDIMRGLIAYWGGSIDRANSFFSTSGSPLGNVMMSGIIDKSADSFFNDF